MNKKMVWLVLGLVALVLAVVFLAMAPRPLHSSSEFSADPRILSPLSEKIDLTGQKTLVFTWDDSGGSAGRRRYFDFRIYKGYQRYEPYIIFKQRLEPTVFSIEVDTALFEDGGRYTWSLAQSFMGQGISNEAYSLFTVTKKE